MRNYEKNKVVFFELIFISLLFIIKLTLFNNLIDNLVDRKVFLSVGIIYMLFLIVVLSIFSQRLRSIVFLIIYSLISVIMLIDSVYFKQFNKLTSLMMIKQFSQLRAVTDSILYLLSLKNLLLVLDIIPLVVYFLFIRKRIIRDDRFENSKFKYKRKKKIYRFGLVMIFIATSLYTGINSSGTSLNNEFFNYHIRDAFEVAIGNKEDVKMDYSILNKDHEIDNDNKELFGIAKDRNVITIQVEALQSFVINNFYEGQEIMPNLNKLIREDSIYYDNYYQQVGLGNTSDAEFVSHNSLYPTISEQSYTKYQDNTFYGLPWLLKDNGYDTIAMHGFDGSFWNRKNAYPKQGFDRFISKDDYDLKEEIGLGLSDEEFFKQSIEYLKELKDPYYAFLVTLTSHHPYDMPEEYDKIKLKDEHKGTLLGNYILSIHYLDEQIGMFIEDLKREGLYENTIVNIYGDHSAISYGKNENEKMMSDYLGFDYDYDEMMRIPLITHIPNSKVKKVNSVAGGQIDFYPTVLNLLGLSNEKGLMFGRDLNNSDKGFVAQQTYVLKGSFMNNDNMFIMSRDGIFENSRAFNMDTRKPIDLESCRNEYNHAIKSIDMSKYILDNDLLKNYINGDKSLTLDNDKSKSLKKERYISHAGGRVKGVRYTNSKEALDKSYENGYKLIELDMEWTTDDNLVLIHDWDWYVEKAFGAEKRQYSTKEFKDFTMIEGLTQMTIDDLAKWLKKHDDVCIVTDIKTRNVEALKLISERYPDLVDRFKPQIYSFEEYASTVTSGFHDIILTLYMTEYTDEQVIDFANRNDLMAITMPINRAKTDFPKKLKEEGHFTYTHTVNDKDLESLLDTYGIDGYYTDDILPK